MNLESMISRRDKLLDVINKTEMLNKNKETVTVPYFGELYEIDKDGFLSNFYKELIDLNDKISSIEYHEEKSKHTIPTDGLIKFLKQ